MNPVPRVSTVITCYNYGRFLAGAIESARAQTFTSLEIIVVDDGSTDETPSVIQPFLSDPRIVYHRTEHLGHPGAKNAGIRLCRGDLIAFLDADDLWLPTKLEKQVSLIDAHPEVGVVSCRRLVIDEFGRPVAWKERPLHRGDVLAPMFLAPFVCFSSSLVRREVFERVGMFDEEFPLPIDYDLWLRAALVFAFDYVDEPLVAYRTGHANLSRREVESSKQVTAVMKRFLARPEARERLPAALVRRAWADLCWDTAWANRHDRKARLAWCLKALGHDPMHLDAWRGVLSSWWPDIVKRGARRLLGSRDDAAAERTAHPTRHGETPPTESGAPAASLLGAGPAIPAAAASTMASGGRAEP